MTQKFYVKDCIGETYERLCRTYVGSRCTIRDDIELEVDDISTYKFEMENYQLRVLLERYGRVENISTSYNLL